MGLFDAVGNIIGGLIGYGSQNSQNKINYKIAQENLGFQRENLDYQKALQKQIFEREDTAYQRTVNDMRLSGLNPVSMQGTNSSGEAIPTEPLHNDFQFQSAFGKILESVQAVSNMRNNSSLTNAQANLINQQAENQRIKNLFESDILQNTLSGLKYDNVGKRFQNELSNIDWLNKRDNYNFNVQYGLTENMPDIVKLSALLGSDKIFNRSFYDLKDVKNFGKGVTHGHDNISSNDFLDSQRLAGAIRENQIINGLLSLIPMGIGNLFSR